VTGVTHLGYLTKSLARWNKPICPLAAGIPADQGEFILRGVSQAALAAGAKLGPRKCKANLHVVVTSEPDQLLDLWRKRAPRLFGGESRTAVRHVMSKPRPIRVWYNAQEVCGEEGWTGTQDASSALGQLFAAGGCQIKDTRLEFNVVRPISSVIVLVDFDDVQQMKLGALTDYISMVGLAQVDLDGDWGDAPTVLRLFSNSADVGAQRMRLGSEFSEGSLQHAAKVSLPAFRDCPVDGARLRERIRSRTAPRCHSLLFTSDSADWFHESKAFH
jgi:hypothetical protein